MNFIIKCAKVLLLWNVRKARLQKRTQARIDSLRARKPKRPLISILLPVYNVAEFLPICLESLLAQTYENLEIIAVNDASTDDSLTILQGYAAKNAQIKLFEQAKNQGLPQTRRAALAEAQGTWVLNVDSDDWLEPTMVEDMWLLAQEGADVVVCDYFKKGNIVRQPKIHENQVFERIRGRSFGYGNTIWNRLVRREVFEKIVFPTENAGEDIVINTQLYFCAGKIVYCAKPLYHWRTNDRSLTNQLTEATFDSLKINYDWIWTFCQEKFGAKAAMLEPLYLRRLQRIHRKP